MKFIAYKEANIPQLIPQSNDFYDKSLLACMIDHKLALESNRTDKSNLGYQFLLKKKKN